MLGAPPAVRQGVFEHVKAVGAPPGALLRPDTLLHSQPLSITPGLHPLPSAGPQGEWLGTIANCSLRSRAPTPHAVGEAGGAGRLPNSCPHHPLAPRVPGMPIGRPGGVWGGSKPALCLRHRWRARLNLGCPHRASPDQGNPHRGHTRLSSRERGKASPPSEFSDRIELPASHSAPRAGSGLAQWSAHEPRSGGTGGGFPERPREPAGAPLGGALLGVMSGGWQTPLQQSRIRSLAEVRGEQGAGAPTS